MGEPEPTLALAGRVRINGPGVQIVGMLYPCKKEQGKSNPPLNGLCLMIREEACMFKFGCQFRLSDQLTLIDCFSEEILYKCYANPHVYDKKQPKKTSTSRKWFYIIQMVQAHLLYEQ